MGIDIFDPDGAKKYPHIAIVEQFLGGIGRLVFEDGTVQFAENETYPKIVYSPRLSEAEMESFCKENLSHYEKYFDENINAIDAGNALPEIDKFW